MIPAYLVKQRFACQSVVLTQSARTQEPSSILWACPNCYILMHENLLLLLHGKALYTANSHYNNRTRQHVSPTTPPPRGKLKKFRGTFLDP